jgi:hypothetical protein
MPTARSLRLRLALSRRAAAHHPLSVLSGAAAALGTVGDAAASAAPAATRASAAARSVLALVVCDMD